MSEDNGQASLSVEELYIKEKKKSQIFMMSTAVLIIILVGYFLVSFNSNESRISSAPSASQPVPGMRQGGGVPMSDYFYNNGELNTQAVDERFASIPVESQAQFIDRFTDRIQGSVDTGEITQAQADEFINYLYYGMNSGSEEI